MESGIPFFSIIIPVYNAQKYLNRCLDSLRLQSFSDYEVLLIDDDSTDGSFQICIEICQVDERFRYFRKKHAGASAARNQGIVEANGEYIAFVDADDSIDSLMLEKLHDTITANELPDVCYMNSHFIVSGDLVNTNTVFYLDNSIDCMKCYSPEFFLELVTQNGSHMPGSTCLIVANRVFLIDNQLMFNTQLTWSEDSDFSYQAFVHAQKIKCCNYCGYYYYIENTESVSKKFSLDKAMGRMDVYMKWCRYFMENKAAVQKFSEYCRERLMQQLLSEYCAALNTCIESKESFNRKLLYAKAKDEYSVWKNCQNPQYREYVRLGPWAGGEYRKLKMKIKHFVISLKGR